MKDIIIREEKLYRRFGEHQLEEIEKILPIRAFCENPTLGLSAGARIWRSIGFDKLVYGNEK